MKKAFIVFLLPLVLIGCAKEVEIIQVQSGNLHEVVFHAGWIPETKTVLQEDMSVWWSPGDEISLFSGPSTNGGYKLTSTNDEPAASVDFVGQIGDNPNTPKYVAVYPYNTSNYYDGTTLKVTIPYDQVATEGTFDKNAFISVAVSEDDNLFFNNICSGIKFSVSTPGVERIFIHTNDNVGISGNVINNQFADSPYQTYVADCPCITIYAPDESGFEPGKYYYAVLLPFKNKAGITVNYFKGDSIALWHFNDSIEFKRGVIKRLINKDEGLRFNKDYKSRAYLNSAFMVPEGVDKTAITKASFHVLSDKQTDLLLRDDGAPIYFELIGTEAYYYTPAEIYEVLDEISFAGWRSLKTIDLSNIDTRHATSFYGMFDGCISLESLDLSSFDTENVTSMRSMFGGCQSLKSINFSGWNTKKVSDMMSMFGPSMTGHGAYQAGPGCMSLENLDLSMFNTSNVTDMTMMFSGCYNLKDLNLSGWNTGNVESMSSMFEECYSLNKLDLSSFNTENLTNMSSMFINCFSLDAIDCSSFDTRKVTNMVNLFLGCYSLRDINLSSFSYESLCEEGLDGVFDRCRYLKKIDLGDVPFPQNVRLYWSFFETSRNSRACAIRCTRENQEIILNSANQDINNPWTYSAINLDYFTWTLPGEPIPDLPDAIDTNLYRSTDYSDDGKIVLLQEATEGRGIDIILIGDAYSDRLIKDGTYKSDIEEAVEAIFSLEPYKTYKNLFNVYMVVAVSPNEVSSGETALNFRAALVPGCQSDVYSYTRDVVRDKYAADIATVVISHDENCLGGSGADGKTVLYYALGSKDEPLDFGQAREAIAYIPRFSDSDRYRYVVSHEFGHCFAKLADEYVVFDETVPEWVLDDFDSGDYVIIKKLGIYRNIDFTSDPSLIKWSRFLNDPRYDGTDTGVFEGGFEYSRGVWRPSSVSIMASSGDHFNAPSREAIYNRIHKLAYGYDWVYDYESFVEYDMKNIEAEKAAAHAPIRRVNSRHINHSGPSFEIRQSTNQFGEKIITIIMD